MVYWQLSLPEAKVAGSNPVTIIKDQKLGRWKTVCEFLFMALGQKLYEVGTIPTPTTPCIRRQSATV